MSCKNKFQVGNKVRPILNSCGRNFKHLNYLGPIQPEIEIEEEKETEKQPHPINPPKEAPKTKPKAYFKAHSIFR